MQRSEVRVQRSEIRELASDFMDYEVASEKTLAMTSLEVWPLTSDEGKEMV